MRSPVELSPPNTFDSNIKPKSSNSRNLKRHARYIDLYNSIISVVVVIVPPAPS